MSINIDINGIEASAMVEIQKQLNELAAKLEPILEELIEEERQKIIERGIKRNQWLYNIIYRAVSQGMYQAVYSAYSPVEYERRYHGVGGLASKKSFEAVVMDDGDIEVYNTAHGNPKYAPMDINLEEIILSGNGYHYPVGREVVGDFHAPRNFYAAAHAYYDVSKVQKQINDRIEKKMQTIINKAMKQIK